MHIGLFTVGSRGDVQPYLALALGLIGRGHQVTIAAPENFKGFVEAYGVNFFPLYGDMQSFLLKPEGREIIRKGNGIAIARYLFRETSKVRFKLRDDLMQGCKDLDFIVANLTMVFLIAPITEKLNKKWAVINLNPPAVPTKEFPFPQFDFLNYPWYNLLTYRLVRSFIWSLNKKDTLEFRNTLGLPELKVSFPTHVANSNIPVLHCFSEQLISRPNDWTNNHQICGFLTLRKEARKKAGDDNIPDSLVNWLKGGEKPVYMGFGSIPVLEPEAFKQILNEILERSTHRLILCEGWSHFVNLPVHPNLYVVKEINHDWLFPQCKTAIVHGGIGTLSAVLRAKIPVIVASIIADQPMWGKIIEKKKIGVHIPFRKISTRGLLNAIAKTQQPPMIAAAQAIGNSISQEDGVKKAVEQIEA